jgi:hypothetical protein
VLLLSAEIIKALSQVFNGMLNLNSLSTPNNTKSSRDNSNPDCKKHRRVDLSTGRKFGHTDSPHNHTTVHIIIYHKANCVFHIVHPFFQNTPDQKHTNHI